LISSQTTMGKQLVQGRCAVTWERFETVTPDYEAENVPLHLEERK